MKYALCYQDSFEPAGLEIAIILTHLPTKTEFLAMCKYIGVSYDETSPFNDVVMALLKEEECEFGTHVILEELNELYTH